MANKNKILLMILFFGLLFAPLLHFVGLKENYIHIDGVDPKIEIPRFSLSMLSSRKFQNTFEEYFAKEFFLRKFCLKTHYQIYDWLNFGKFHAGFSGSIIQGKNNTIYESCYVKFHLEHQKIIKNEYQNVLETLQKINKFCQSHNIDFIYILVPDKVQLIPENCPNWLDIFWNFKPYDVQSDIALLCQQNEIPYLNCHDFLCQQKESWQQKFFPRYGSHWNALGAGLCVNEIMNKVNNDKTLPEKYNTNPLTKVQKCQERRYIEFDLGLLLNLWLMPNLDDNYMPFFQKSYIHSNQGNILLYGDSFIHQIRQSIIDAGLFSAKNIIFYEQEPPAPDKMKTMYPKLKIFILCLQSINSYNLPRWQSRLQQILESLESCGE